ncbi:MAG: homoserine dehydrogenase [Phycisphaerales bacterium]|nr:homoserine dehydrogenase [Phycisphaerales bacterium]MCB9857365.1 homoserine dehydrogenase [Phycisphaerales bacterium]
MAGIALIGCGTVGTQVFRILASREDRFTHLAGAPLEVRHVVVRDPGKKRDPGIPSTLLSSNAEAAISDPAVSIVCELMGGIDEARRILDIAIANRKHVVTANKALLAEHGASLFSAARSAGVSITFEGAVCGGIPLIDAVRRGLIANEITAVYGILNGTCNYILTQMLDRQTSYADALAKAQSLGYAEADPTLDIDGTDAAHKLAILASVAMRENIAFNAIPMVRGIQDLQLTDLIAGRELGYTCKLLAVAERVDAGVQLSVRPTFIPSSHPLAKVDGAFNAVSIYGDAVGHVLLYGRGAGGGPTASAVVADIIDTAIGTAQATFDRLGPYADGAKAARVVPTDENETAHYIRVELVDRPGGMARIAQVLADEGISIASLVQHAPEGSAGSEGVPVVATTHVTRDDVVHRAVDVMNKLDVVRGPVVCIPAIEERPEF